MCSLHSGNTTMALEEQGHTLQTISWPLLQSARAGVISNSTGFQAINLASRQQMTATALLLNTGTQAHGQLKRLILKVCI